MKDHEEIQKEQWSYPPNLRERQTEREALIISSPPPPHPLILSRTKKMGKGRMINYEL